MSEHAKFSPSSLYRIVACPGSFKLSEGIEQPSNIYAERGTLMHSVAESLLRYGVGDITDTVHLEEKERDIVWTYVDYVSDLPGFILLEHQVVLPIEGGDCWGTADAIHYHDGVLEVVDLKTGHGIVYPENNYQLGAYAIGAVHSLPWLGDFDRFKLTIVQPRDYDEPIKSITVDLEYLDDMFADISLAIDNARSKKPPLNPTLDGCRYCPAQADCPALYEKLSDKIGNELTAAGNDTLSEYLDVAELAQSWANAVFAKAEAELLNGTDIDGWKVVRGRSTRRWSDEIAAEKTMRRKGAKVKDIFTKKLISPAQAEKLFGKKVLAGHADIMELITSSDGKLAIARDSDKRPAVKVNAMDEFENLDS